MTNEAVLALRADPVPGVALITLNRPQRANAWTIELQSAYFDELDAAVADDKVRAIVVTGAGDKFCVGADASMLDGVREDGRLSRNGDARSDSHPLLVPKPLIGAINGSAAGIGLVHALYCDVRFVAEEARLTTAFVRRGLVAEGGISWLLPQIVGRARALDLLLSGRTFDGTEAARLGLADQVVPAAQVVSAAVTYAADLAANCSPSSMAAVKQAVTADAVQAVSKAITDSDRLRDEALRSIDFGEGVQSFLERRAPAFLPYGEATPFSDAAL